MLRDLSDRLLDASILFSFDRTGHRRHARRFRASDLDVDLDGRVCLVTGANAGLGRAAALELAARGARVLLGCRDVERGLETEDAVRKATGNPRVRLELVDLSSLASVGALAARLPEPRIDVLVHNAGLLPERRVLSEDGLELCFATHVVGPFLLTRLLEERMRAAQRARVIFVSSGGMYTQRLSLRDLDWSERKYDGVRAYAQTKRMQVVLSDLFAARYRGTGITANAMHPGWADTGGVRESLPRFWRLMRPLLRTAREGADTIVWLAASRQAASQSGLFWMDRAPQPTHLLPGTRESEEERRALWQTCESLVGLGRPADRP